MIRLELKYCERCGGLLLRRTGDAVVYCGSCAKSVNELPVVKRVEKAAVRKGAEVRAESPHLTRPATQFGENWGRKKEPQSVGIEGLQGASSPEGKGPGTRVVGERRLG
jgi:uncharacterized Zn finger protein (UPF0148 family)